ncbi:ubiquitin-conjugating enzyme/RWD-like protein [Gaertneriomyces semiglobifer]|nr:ubiquitin-conjugating enzyme/RWD-like protein [Gaertneriomyces semiglobifer]
MSDRSILRIQKELYDIQKSPDTAFHIFYDESNIKHVHALILGPPNTPYHLGMFEFVFNMSNDYPTNPPKVTATTTNSGHTRFNPNIYANGKVCLSILGTWEARENGEKWSAAHGLLSVLISIQSLLSDKPYHNEPGHENETDELKIKQYNQKIMHETLRISICDRLEEYLSSKSRTNSNSSSPSGSPKATVLQRQYCPCRATSPFTDLCKRMFLMYYDVYMSIVEKERELVKDGTTFINQRFELGTNSMSGTFGYASIKDRLSRIYKQLLAESESWKKHSLEWLKDDTTTASNLKSQFAQITSGGNDFDHQIMFELVDGNPFIWSVVVMGMPMTIYDEGMWKIEIVFCDNFPDVQPRVKFLGEFWHPCVSKEGVPYLRVQRPDQVSSYVKALQDLFTGDPFNDPTTHLNLAAATQYFGNQEQKRDFKRCARRCARATAIL